MANSVQTATGPRLTLERRFKAPREKVYAAWTDPAQLAQWFGRQNEARVAAEIDLRVGGRYIIRIEPKSGDGYHVSGLYREIAPNRKLVFTWAWGGTPDRVSLVTVTFRADGAETVMTLQHGQFFDEDARNRHETGWKQGLEKLAALLASDTGGMPAQVANGKFCWHELMTRDVEGTKRFYAETLGWTYDKFQGGGMDYWIIKVAGEGMGGMFDISDKSFDGMDAR